MTAREPDLHELLTLPNAVRLLLEHNGLVRRSSLVEREGLVDVLYRRLEKRVEG